jgi:CDP-4-dehydro-6-deoxyglucose reductase, E1
MINLVKNTISEKEIEALCLWLKSFPRLTKGIYTDQFEHSWSDWIERKSSLFVTSGSSANLAAFYAFLLSGKLKNKKVILPAVSWSTTIAPAIQLGFEPILCDCNLTNYGLDLDHLKHLIKKHSPGLVVACNVLGFANDYEEILKLCKENSIYTIEDSCEAVGTIYKGKKVGTFGDISTFSFYYGHHMSTIEGGMVTTDNEELSKILRSIRCHGWDRDLKVKDKVDLRKKYNIDEFKALYTFYYPGFNMRATDLQAFIGLGQMQRLEEMNILRYKNFKYMHSKDISGWELDVENYDFISNMAYPTIPKDIEKTRKKLVKSKIEHRPLICGSIGLQPFWTDRYGKTDLRNATKLHNCGIYVPNNPDLTNAELEKITSTLWELK